MKTASNPPCPCGGLPAGTPYQRCCGLLIEGDQVPATAERLMRSRYTAYTLGLARYLQATWHPGTRPIDLEVDPPDTPHGVRWLGLRIHGHRELDADHAEVKFTARYRQAGKAFRLTELSRFLREDGRWLYVDGDVDERD